MAMDRQGTGLTITRVSIGLFFLAEGASKYRWFTDSSALAGQLATWAQNAPSGSLHGRFVEHVALPWVAYFARLVPLGEITCGVALIVGFWTSLFALVAFLMALTFQFGSGALFKLSFLTSGYGLPVLGSTLGLAIGAVRLPWSLRP
jgi:uncharacterized membrane protein YphA (DoxX/SURF4 family)